MKKIDPIRFNRRQKVTLVGVVAVLLVIVGGIMWQTRTDNNMALLELPSSAYEYEGLVEISAEEYAEKAAAGEVLLVLAHNTSCPAGMPLTSVVKELTHKYSMVVYGLIQDEFRETELAKEVKFLPSLVVQRGEQTVAFLDAASDEDLPAYKSLEGLEEWLGRYIKL